ncbi:MAG: adenylate/guanylate cyclase domain-containing protein [Actinomycetota bacterium]
MRRRRDDGRALATVLFTDIVGSTELASELGDVHWKQVLATHHGVVRKTLKRYNGHEVDTAGDGFFATFARPADAIRCASDIIDQLREIGIHIRAGIHMGEVEQMGAKVGGIAVHIGARVAAKAGADEILVSSTVRDLVSGSDIRFGERGAYDLKGVPGQWNLLAVERELKEGVPDRPLVEAPQAKAARRRTIPALAAGIAAALLLVIVLALVLLLRGSGTSNVVAVPGPNTASRIDPRSNHFAGTVTVGDGPVDAVAGGGSIWVLNAADQTFSRIDATSGKLVSAARSVGGTPTGVAFGAGSIWITTQFGSTSGQSGSVLRFDPGGGGPKKVIPVGNGVASIAFGDGAIWVTNTVTNTVSQIDTDANAVVATTPVGNSPQAVVAGGGSVWVANTLDNSVWKIDEKTGHVLSRVTLLAPPTGLALDGTTLWVVSETGNTVSKVDASSGTTVATIPVGAQPAAIVAGPSGVWVVADAGHDVERIDPAKSSVTARLKVDGSPDGIALDGDRVWVTVRK